MEQTTDYLELMIPTYIINLKERTERREHILTQFKGKPEFDIHLIEACRHEIGAIGLWNSIVTIVKIAVKNNDDVIIICEDDHEFTDAYTPHYMMKNIFEANEQQAAILSGGIGRYADAVPLTKNRFWVNLFLSTQFIILYKKIFDKILNYQFKSDDVADKVLAEMTSHKMVLYPFISQQKDFGYSDITSKHNEIPGLVQDMFKRTNSRLEIIQKAYLQYRQETANQTLS
jgi:hypothetical protein